MVACSPVDQTLPNVAIRGGPSIVVMEELVQAISIDCGACAGQSCEVDGLSDMGKTSKSAPKDDEMSKYVQVASGIIGKIGTKSL